VPTLGTDSESLTLFTEGDDLYGAMLDSIRSARQSIRLESYIFADDGVGRRFAEAFAERARAGIDVRVHLDAAGSLFWASRELERYLTRQGVQVRWYHRWSWRQPWRYNRRNHRKLLVVDGQRVYLGGFNIHRENSRAVFGIARWRDTHVGLSGSLAVQAAELFDAFWSGERNWDPPSNQGENSVLLSNHSHRCRRQVRCLYLDALEGARHSLFLTTPYFVPDHRTQKEIMEAASRGVDVRLLVPRRSDVRLARWAAQAAYANLLRTGVRIYEYLPRVLHAKTAVADESFAIIGTANLDYRSFFMNLELNLFTRDPVLCSQLQDQFWKDLTESEEISSGKWSRRSWGRHLSETVGWITRRWL
jgi:cardiolipin synthase